MRAVLIDVGGTLWSERGEKAGAGGGPARAPLPATANSTEGHRQEWELRLRNSGVAENRVGALCSQLNLAAGAAIAQERFDVWSAIDDAAALAGVVNVTAERLRAASCLPAPTFTSPLPDARSLLDSIKRRGWRTVVVTNAVWRTSDDYWRDFRSFDMADPVDAIVSSVNLLWRKPSGAFFEAALREAAVPAEECLIIGNSETNDIAPGKRLGMLACRVAIEEPVPLVTAADYVCASLGEVATALAGL